MARKPSAAPIRKPRSRRPRRGVVRQILTDSRLVMLLLLSSGFLALMTGLTIWGERGVLAMWRQQHDIVQLGREIDAIQEENLRLGRQIDRLQHDMGYIEKIAREELGLVRPGELVFEFVE